MCLSLGALLDVYVGLARVALERVGCVELRVARVALSAEGHVHVLSANHCHARLARRAESKTCIGSTLLADCSELLDFLAFGHECEHLRERTPHESPLQRGDDHDFARVGGFFREFDEVFEELALVDGDDLAILPLFVVNVGQLGRGLGQLFETRVRADHPQILTVALVRRKLYPEHCLARLYLFVAPAKQLCRLASEHASDDQLNSATLRRIRLH